MSQMLVSPITLNPTLATTSYKFNNCFYALAREAMDSSNTGELGYLVDTLAFETKSVDELEKYYFKWVNVDVSKSTLYNFRNWLNRQSEEIAIICNYARVLLQGNAFNYKYWSRRTDLPSGLWTTDLERIRLLAQPSNLYCRWSKLKVGDGLQYDAGEYKPVKQKEVDLINKLNHPYWYNNASIGFAICKMVSEAAKDALNKQNFDTCFG